MGFVPDFYFMEERNMKKKLAMLLTLTMMSGLLLTGCNTGSNAGTGASQSAKAELVYAVEAGSAGEEGERLQD